MKVFSTFTGIGGFEIGIDHAAARAGQKIEYVGYSEIDQRCISVYEKHFKGVKNYGDITKIDAESLPDFDCLVGGFPCQAFSILGQRKGFEDTRGTLFFDLARILQAKGLRIPEATKAGFALAYPGQAVNLSMPNSRSRRGRVSDVSPTLDTGMWIYTVTNDNRLRRLTPKECERLQAFPDDWTATGILNEQFSDRQRYKMLGNAVTTNVIQSVFERILA